MGEECLQRGGTGERDESHRGEQRDNVRFHQATNIAQNLKLMNG